MAGASAQRRAPPSPVARPTEGTLQGKKKLATHSRVYTLSDWWFLPPGGNAISSPARSPLIVSPYGGAYAYERVAPRGGEKLNGFQTV